MRIRCVFCKTNWTDNLQRLRKPRCTSLPLCPSVPRFLPPPLFLHVLFYLSAEVIIIGSVTRVSQRVPFISYKQHEQWPPYFSRLYIIGWVTCLWPAGRGGGGGGLGTVSKCDYPPPFPPPPLPGLLEPVGVGSLLKAVIERQKYRSAAAK
jgi:hypothetical protein